VYNLCVRESADATRFGVHPFAETRNTQFKPEFNGLGQNRKTYKMHYVNEALRVYCVGDAMAGTVLQAGKPWREHAAPVALLCLVVQQRVSYFFYSPMPFLEAAKMLPIVARASKQSVMNAFKSLNTCLSFTLPISVPSQVLFGPSIDAADKIRAHVRAQNRVCAV
jgi:hypothetical protein